MCDAADCFRPRISRVALAVEVRSGRPPHSSSCRAGRVPGLVLVAVCAGMMTHGCVRFRPLALDPSQNAVGLENRCLDDPGLGSFMEENGVRGAWPRESWDLRSLTLAAFYFSPELELARSRWRTIRAGLQSAAQRPNPALSLAPLYDSTTLIPSPWILLSSLQIPIETAGRRSYRMARARSLSEAAALDIVSAAWSMRTRLRATLVDLFAARERERIFSTRQALLEEGLKLLGGQLQAGAVSAAELMQGRIAVDAARLDTQAARGRLAQARIALAETIGLTAHALDGVRVSFEGLDRTPPDLNTAAARRRALLSRADILAALSRYRAAEAALRLEIARQYPNLRLGPAYEFDQGDNKWGVEMALELPLFNRNRGPIGEAEARRAQSAAGFNALQARVLAEIDSAIAAYRSTIRELQSAEELLSGMEKQETRLRGRFDAGDIARGELINGRLLLASARLTRLEVLAGAQRSLGRVEEALQSPLSSPLERDSLTRVAGPGEDAGPSRGRP